MKVKVAKRVLLWRNKDPLNDRSKAERSQYREP
jgi:hypothetical protein